MFYEIFLILFLFNRLLVTPLIPILEETQCPTICELPIISNKFNATVMHVEAINLIYVQKPEINDLLSGLLEDMFSFYETQGEFLISVDII